MIREEQKFINKVAELVDKTIDKAFDREGLDRAFFVFELKCSVLDSGLTSKLGEYTLIDDNEYFCCFCGEKSMYHHPKIKEYVCSKCLRNYAEAGENKAD